ncbi:MAG: hypothetical protein CSA66_05305 [Proteobacteria bacterium]|nr:MAG: hypothetical protein CSA66_05305 [Pseudomonadota bacterium]
MSAPALTVIAPSYGDGDKLPALLASLRAQTLAPERFEVLVVDDGQEPPLTLAAEDAAGVRLVRQRHAGPAAARNMALRHARGRVVLFVNADGSLAPDALERHLAAHPPDGPARAVLGRFDWLPEHRTALIQVAERLGVFFPYDRLRPHGDNPFWACWTGNLSVPTATVRDIGGFDETFERALWEDVELGYRLERAGVPVFYDPGIGCGHDHAVTFDAWLRRAEWYGHEWVRFARKHGGAAWPILGGADEPTPAFARQCLDGLLNQRDLHDRRIHALRRRLEAGDTDVAELFVAVNTVACMKGIAGAIWEHDPDALAARAEALRRPALVHTVADERDLAAAPRLLDVIGPDARLLIASYIYVPPGALPVDPRVQLIRVPRALPADQMWRPVLEATDREALVFLEGPPLPTTAQLRALTRFLDVSPWIGAIGLAAPQGLPHTSGRIVDRAPRHVVATTRRILELDPGGPGSFLDRLPRRQLYQVALVPGGD